MTVATSMSVGRADGSVAPPQLIYVGKVDGTPGRVVAIWAGKPDSSPLKIYSDTSPPAPPPPPPSSPKVTPNPNSRADNASYSPGNTYTYGGSCDISGGTPPYTTNWNSQTASGQGQSGQVTISPTGPGRYTASISFSVSDANGQSGSATCNFVLTVS